MTGFKGIGIYKTQDNLTSTRQLFLLYKLTVLVY